MCACANAEKTHALIAELQGSVKQHTAKIEHHMLEKAVVIKRIKRLEEHVAGLQGPTFGCDSAMRGIENHGEESHGDAGDEFGVIPSRRQRKATPYVNGVPSTWV